ncbi:MAG: hypothetical protein P1P86_04350 [Bacteroidales bacterium]|nr:hypothetical protein [Bacteroidales bacterium]
MFIVRAIRESKGLLISSLFLLLNLPAEGQLIRVQSLLSRDSLMIGDQIEYTLRVDADSAVDFILPAISDTLNRALEVLSPLSSDTIVSGDRKVVEQSYLITVFEPGLQMVPSQEVIYMRGALPDTARSMPLVLRVYAPEVDTAGQIKPIKPPVNTPLTLREVLPWAAAGLGGLLLVGAVVWLLLRFLKRKKDPEGQMQKSQEPAHIIAFRELDRLKNEKIWARGLVKEYYTRLTEITRRYIERQYGIAAMESTTEEILYAFRKVNLEDKLLEEMLSELLELADLVKFAREDPLPLDNQTHLNNVYFFVQKTYPLFYRQEEKQEDRP